MSSALASPNWTFVSFIPAAVRSRPARLQPERLAVEVERELLEVGLAAARSCNIKLCTKLNLREMFRIFRFKIEVAF